MRSPLYLAAVVSLIAGSVWLHAQQAAPGENKVLAARIIDPQPERATTPDSAYATYTIGAEDVLTIDVWKEPEISRTLPVRTDGKISLPLLNDVQAAGLTPTQLSAEITQRLRSAIVNPQVAVIVTQMNSQRVYILGQVTHAGPIPLVPGMTVVQALSNAGGFTPFANLKKTYVLRTENGKKQMFPVNYKDAITGHSAAGDIQLKTGDTIVVP